MTNLSDLGVSAALNIGIAFAFLVAFAVLRLQPTNDRVYYPKWYIKGVRRGARRSGRSLSNIVNLNWRSYLHFLDWTREALIMPEPELIEHAGLDSAVYLRMYLLGLKVFVPLMLMGFILLVPINVTGGNLGKDSGKDFEYSDIDKLSIANVKDGSQRYWAHVCMAYVFTAWICAALYMEYDLVATMRLRFLDSRQRRPDQFTVLVRNIPSDPDESVSLHLEHFFRVNHPYYYLTHQIVYNANKLAKLVKQKEGLQNWLDFYQIKYMKRPNERPIRKKGFLGLWGEKVDAIDYYTGEIDNIKKKAAIERERVLDDPKAILPVAFVSFKGRWGAAVAAQTQQSKNPTLWLTEWAPEPRDVYWKNLAIPFVELTVRKLLINVALFFLVFFFMIPITIVQSLANIEGISRKVPFLRPVLKLSFISSFLQGFLPGLALKIFLLFLPTILMIMSKIEGHTSLSLLERRSAAKYYYFMIVNVFFGSILAGTASQQLNNFIHESPSDIPKTVGNSVAQKANFFITYIMVDGWAGIAGEILRLKPLIIYHLKNIFLVRTEKDRDNAMDPGSAGLDQALPQVELYFLLGIMYAPLTPIILPFIIIYFAFSYVVYRHQVINVYDQEYESAGAFWPHVHGRIISIMVIQQICFLGVLGTKQAKDSTPLLLVVPVLTIAFHVYCKRRFEPAFRKYPLEEAMAKDTLERATEPNLNLKGYLQSAYMHPIFKADEDDEQENDEGDWEEKPALVPTKRQSRGTTPAASVNSESPVYGKDQLLVEP